MRPGWKKTGRRGDKRMALQTSPDTWRCPGVTGLFPGLPGREEGNSTLPENGNQIPDQNSSSLPTRDDQAPTLRSGWGPPTTLLRPGPGQKKKRVRQEGLKRGKREGRGKRSIKSFVLYLVGALWPVIHVKRRPWTKGSQLRPLVLVCRWMSWSLSTLSGQDVNCREEEVPQESPFVAGRWALV